MSGIEIFKWLVSGSVAAMMLLAPAILLYYFVTEKTVRVWVIRMIENDDGGPDKNDGKDSVMLFFAYVSSVVAVGILLGWWITGENMWEVETASGALSGALFGISKFNNTKN